jgi:hypothetical protein
MADLVHICWRRRDRTIGRNPRPMTPDAASGHLAQLRRIQPAPDDPHFLEYFLEPAAASSGG